MRLPRYLAVIGARDPFGAKRAVREAMGIAGLQSIYAHGAIEVFSDGPPPTLLCDGSGVVLGPIYPRSHPMASVTEFDAASSRVIVDQAGQALIEHYWGNYLAILASEAETVVIRPPFSDLECLTTSYRGLRFVTSDLALLRDCGMEVRKLDWDGVAYHLAHSALRRTATCIAGVSELPWGSRLSVDDDITRTEPCWSPWRFIDTASAARSNADIAEALRDRVLACVAAQVRDYDQVQVLLSGGLDSSILSAAVAASGTGLTCLNLPFGDSAGDERHFARAVAARLGVPLYEIEPDLGEVDVMRSEAKGRARPIARSFAQATRAVKRRIANATGASVVLDGGGGDNVFCSLQSVAPVADRLRAEGIRGALASAADIALLTEAGLPRVLARSVQRAYLRGPAYRWKGDVRFLSPTAIERAGKPDHRWLVPPRGALPGSAAQIALLVVIENLLESADGDLAEWSPLMAQPIVELCLSIPTWRWFAGGQNRMVARRAFEALLPPDIAWRRGKGSPDAFVAQVFERNRARLRSLLLDGVLAEQGLLDRGAIEAALAPDRPVTGNAYTRLLKVADVEAWARSL